MKPIWDEISLGPLSSILFDDIFKDKLYGYFLASSSDGYIDDFLFFPVVRDLDLYPLVVCFFLLFEILTALENMRFLQLHHKSTRLLRLAAAHFNKI